MKIVAVVQARMGSTRLPGKVMKPVLGKPMISYLLERLKKSQRINQIIVATSDNSSDSVLNDYLSSIGVDSFSGSERDVLSRFFQASKKFNADVIVRITGDCPFIDGCLVDDVIEKFLLDGVDYCSNVDPPTYPDGMDIEVFSFDSLDKAHKYAIKSADREHVTPYIRDSGLFSKSNLKSSEVDIANLRWTVDYLEDFKLVETIFEIFNPRVDFSWLEILELQKKNPSLFQLNKSILRNEGMSMGNGQKLWKRAKKVIPGGNMLLSKRSEMFLPDAWPSYFIKAKGCKVWDMDETCYTDMSIMGVGTNILGYGDEEVDTVVSTVIRDGNMSTLNCPEEVYLAEKLVEIHPWADMVKFARTGGEANAIAVRIARASSGRDGVAICGYHGWHDWYLSTNLNKHDGLSAHLLPGLSVNGVPKSLAGTVFPFNYNDFDALQNIVKNNQIGVIKMEVVRNSEPQDFFLSKVRDLASKNNIILIFDECTSGFRETFGGIHKKYKVEPDIAVFGKAMGNGYAITAVIGKREVMDAAQTTFISSTFWTERIGPAAALKTLEVMEREKSWEIITHLGHEIRKNWSILADAHGLKIKQWGIPALAGFSFESQSNLAYKTLITQDMLEHGYLASNCIYASIAHKKEELNNYFELLEKIFSKISKCEAGQRSINEFLHSDLCHDGFKRLN